MATEECAFGLLAFFSFGNQFDIFRGAQTLGSFLLHRAALRSSVVSTVFLKYLAQAEGSEVIF